MSRNGQAILLVGPSGAGKSDLVLRLLSRGFELVADDQVDVLDHMVSCPAELSGLLEVRGLGIMRMPSVALARLVLVADLGKAAERLPAPRVHPVLGCPVVQIDATSASAPERLALALDCALGIVSQVAGAFAA